MKVEFLESNVFGSEMVITASEYVKAKENEQEFYSLCHAVEAFSHLFDADYEITKEEYDIVYEWLEKTGVVIFSIGTGQYPRRKWCEISVSNDNQLQRVIFMDGYGYHIRTRHGLKFNPNAMDTIHKQKAEEGKHEQN